MSKGQLILMAIDIIPENLTLFKMMKLSAAVASDLMSMLIIWELKHALSKMMQPFHNSAFVSKPLKV